MIEARELTKRYGDTTAAHLRRYRGCPWRLATSSGQRLSCSVTRTTEPYDQHQLMSWLNIWGEEFVPATDIEAVQQLERADAGQFARMWTQMTIKRHEDAIALAKGEVENGAHP